MKAQVATSMAVNRAKPFLPKLAFVLAAVVSGAQGQNVSALSDPSLPLDQTKTVVNDLLTHREVFRAISKSGLLGAKNRSVLASQSTTVLQQEWLDRAMAKHPFLWSTADAIEVGDAFVFPGADPKTGIQYAFYAMPNTQTVFGAGSIPKRNAVVLLDLTSDSSVEISPGDQVPARIYGNLLDRSSMERRPASAQAQLQIDLPGLASQFVATASCLWNNITSSLHIQSWSDFTSLACNANSVTDGMVDFGKEIAGCSTGGAADCVFLVSDIGFFVSSSACRPDWANACINAPVPPQGGSGGATPAIILGIATLSNPVPGQQFIAQIHVANLQPGASVAATGPGCPTMTSCVVPSGAINLIGTDYMNVPLTLAQGNFTLYIQQLRQTSNGWPLAVGSAPGNGGNGGNTPNLAISITPNPVPNSGGGSWSYSVTITETGGAAVTLTGLNVGGSDYTFSLAQWFGTNQIPANGRVSGSFTTTGSPGNLTWTVAGGGKSWSASATLLQ